MCAGLGGREQNTDGHRPRAALAEHVRLFDLEAVDAPARVRAPTHAHVGHAATLHPRGGPHVELPSGSLLEGAHEVFPGGVRVGVLFDEELDGLLELARAQIKFRLPEHRGGFAVDDVAVGRLRGGEVRDLLPDGGCAFGHVGQVRERFGSEVEELPGVVLRHQRLNRLVGHEGGEAFLQPQVVEPAHRDEVAEPLVRGLVQHRLGAGGDVCGGRVGGEEHAVLAQEGRARVLHAAVGELRQEHEVVLREGELVAEVAPEELQALAVQAEDFL